MSQAFFPLKSITPRLNVQRLEHFFALEKELVRVQGARIPALEAWFLKQKIGYQLYEDALHAQALRSRRRELQAGSREFPPLQADLQNVLGQVLFAPDDYLFCCALYLGFKPLLAQAYRQHLEESTTFPTIPPGKCS